MLNHILIKLFTQDLLLESSKHRRKNKTNENNTTGKNEQERNKLKAVAYLLLCIFRMFTWWCCCCCFFFDVALSNGNLACNIAIISPKTVCAKLKASHCRWIVVIVGVVCANLQLSQFRRQPAFFRLECFFFRLYCDTVIGSHIVSLYCLLFSDAFFVVYIYCIVLWNIFFLFFFSLSLDCFIHTLVLHLETHILSFSIVSSLPPLVYASQVFLCFSLSLSSSLYSLQIGKAFIKVENFEHWKHLSFSFYSE